MTDQSNLERLKAAYQTWAETKGETDDAREKWLDLFDDHIQIISMDETAAGLAFARNRRAKAEAVDYLLAIVQEWKMIHWTPETFVAEGDQIAMFGKCAWTNRRTQKSMECHVAHLWQFSAGKAIPYTEVFDSARAAAAATPP